MKIGFYNPYFDGFGGGERYTFTLASHWSRQHDVCLFWDDESILKKAYERFEIDLSRVKTTQNIFRTTFIPKKLYLSQQYDVIFVLSDGSIPLTLAKQNILHFQVPFAQINESSTKISCYQTIVCNSLFTKLNLDRRLQAKSFVIYPPINTSLYGSKQKKKYILSVGRFSSFQHAKKQEILIKAFKKGYDQGMLKGWKLLLAGSVLDHDLEYLQQVKNLVKGTQIQIYPNISFADLRKLYAESTLYWHAAGYQESNPKYMEHFGISVVEAMASQSIPISYNGGGLPEIIQHGKNGYLWNSIDELLQITQKILTNNNLLELRKRTSLRAKMFDSSRFYHSFDSVLKRMM